MNLRKRNKILKKIYLFFIVFSSIVGIGFVLNSCSAIYTQIHYRNLVVNTQVSKSIFIIPVPPKQKIIYVNVRNQTTVQNFNLKTPTENALKKAGYKITNDPTRAEFILQANVRELEKVQAGPGYNQSAGESIAGGAAGAATGAVLTNGSAGGAVAGGLVGLLGTMAADSASQVNAFGAIIDVRISQRNSGNLKTTHTTKAQSPSCPKNTKCEQVNVNVNQKYEELSVQDPRNSKWIRYKLQIATLAYKASLKLKDAKTPMAKKTAAALVGLF